MPVSHPEQFDDVSVPCKANVYFDGKVVSHTLLFADGSRKTLGLIYAGSFTFNTDAPEHMAITAGHCRARLKGETQWRSFGPGSGFDVPAKSAFDIAVDDGICQYICSFK
jgi:uncharacterized protein YaiE (UPF0345 family)